MSITEENMEVMRLALEGLRLNAPFMSEAQRKQAIRSLSRFYAAVDKMRRKLLTSRNARALEISRIQLCSAIGGLPRKCHACGARNYFGTSGPVWDMDYLNLCHGTETFDCALSCLRFRSSAYHGPLVPPMPSVKPS